MLQDMGRMPLMPLAATLAVVLVLTATGAHAYTPVELSNEEFFEGVAHPTEKKAMIMLWFSTSCQSCKTIIKTTYKKLASHISHMSHERRSMFMVAKMSVDQFPRLARANGVDRLPTIQLYGWGRDKPELITVEPTAENFIAIADAEIARLEKAIADEAAAKEAGASTDASADTTEEL